MAAVNPLILDPHLAAAEAAEMRNRPADAIPALKALQDMDPIDPALLDYRIAKAMTDLSQYDGAKYHVLRALDEAPRYRDAHRLLLQLHESVAVGDATSEIE